VSLGVITFVALFQQPTLPKRQDDFLCTCALKEKFLHQEIFSGFRRRYAGVTPINVLNVLQNAEWQ
jgi:hypothetical protein